MVKLIASVFLLFSIACLKKDKQALQKNLLFNYNFLQGDIGVTTIKQIGDTLQELKCYIDKPCLPLYTKQFKILSANIDSDLLIMKMEHLSSDSNENQNLEKKFSIFLFHSPNEKQTGFLAFKRGLTQKQLDTINVDASKLTKMFYFTFFTDTYINKLKKLKRVTAKKESEEILKEMKSDKYKKLIKTYLESNIQDMYAAGISAELFNRSCIALGYNPVGAGVAIDSIMKAQ